MNTSTPAITRQELPPHFHQIKADEARFFAEVADITRLSYTEWLAGATELLREIRDDEVNAQDEADKFLRDHVPSELSKVTVQRDRLAEALEQLMAYQPRSTVIATNERHAWSNAKNVLQSLNQPEP